MPARLLARSMTWPLAPALLTTQVVLGTSRSGQMSLTASDLPYVIAMVTCWLGGVLLTLRVPGRLAGWAFLGLGTALAWSAFTDVGARRAMTDDPDLGAALATLGDSSFVWWFLFLALILQLTPSAEDSAAPHALAWTTVAAAFAFQLFALLRTSPIESVPFAGVVSPWAIRGSAEGPIAAAAAAAVLVLGGCLLASLAFLVMSWRRSTDDARRQLLWLVTGAAPIGPCVLASFALSYAGNDEAAGWVMCLAVVSLAVGATLAVLKYRLYVVERVVTETAAYALASAGVLVAFGGVLVVVSRTTPWASTSQVPTIAATLAGVVVARQSFVWARRAVDRHLNRRRFDAVELMRAGLRDDAPDLDELLKQTLSDPRARILYPAADSTWFTSAGRAAEPGEHVVEVRGALVEFDPAHVDEEVVTTVAREAAAEIDNVALRAELARQVEVISESRARLATAHLEERRRIERDLHDGAQQRILAIALQLQSARVASDDALDDNGGDHLLRDAVDRAVTHLGVTVQELRDLAAGLQPAALASGGLVAAIEDLRGRLPLIVTADVPDVRFPAATEGAAWFVVAEAVTNAVKHAHVSAVDISIRERNGGIVVEVTDRGRGGADASGTGLQGLADRVAALGGVLSVHEALPGTTVEAALPCA